MHLVNKMGKPDATDERFVDVFDGGKLLTRWAAALFDGSQAIKSSSLVCACNAVAARVRMAAKSSRRHHQRSACDAWVEELSDARAGSVFLA